MKTCLSVLVMMACFACNGGDGDGDGGVIRFDGGGVGEGGQGGAGEGGQGGAGEGGQGGAGEGGQGGAGEGGQGGMGGMGEGGEGGGCVPMCDGRTCGPDSCGGQCGPGCGDAQVCADGACVAGECPGGTFECGGNCANLLTDPENCGSCGKSCADEWPQQWTDEGFTYEGANIEAVCAQAECTFMCADAETGPQDLIEDDNNCGACGNVCDSGAVNSVQEACVEAQCFCVLTPNGEDGILGSACGDRCTVTGANCGEGCCPAVANGRTAVPANNEQLQLSYRLDLERAQGVQIVPGDDCDNLNIQLVRYFDNGLVGGISQGRCELIQHPVLEAGHYGVIVQPDDRANNSFTFSSAPLQAEFDAPGVSAAHGASGNSVGITFRVVEAGGYRVTFGEAENGGNCDGPGGVYLLNAAGEVAQVLRQVEDCVFDLSGSWEGELAAGNYAVYAATQRLTGPHVVRVDSIDIEPEPDVNPGDGINGPGTYPFPAFGQRGSATLEMTFANGGRFTLTTAGPGGQGCPGDTLLAVRQGQNLVVDNDDAAGVPGNCSRLSFDAEAGVTYQAVVSGYDGGAIGAGTLVVTR